MRKELVCFLNTTEKGIESSFRMMKGESDAVLIEHEGHKFAVQISELKKVLTTLVEFYSSESEQKSSKISLEEAYPDVSYEEEK